MDLWNALANATPSTTLPPTVALAAAAITAALLGHYTPRIFDDRLMGVVVAATAGLLAALGALLLTAAITYPRADEAARTAIETYLEDTHAINALEPIMVNFYARTAEVEGLDAGNNRVHVALEWLPFDARAEIAELGLNDTFTPVTTTITPR